MSLTITNMSMPKNCMECKILTRWWCEKESVHFECNLAERQFHVPMYPKDYEEKGTRPTFCPLREIDVQNVPTADVRKNVRGEWINALSQDENVKRYSCSICNYHVLHRKENFCPDCDADMRKR